MALHGKGFMIWKIPNCEGGNANAIANVAQHAGLTHVLIKVAEATGPYNVDKNKKDLVPPVVQALRSKGIQVWGWHYIYGYNPIGEANIAIQRVKQFALDGYVLNAEIEYKLAGRKVAAEKFMTQLRKELPNTPIGLSSFRFPNYHTKFPWEEFLSKCDYNMPQVYWQNATNAGAQLVRSIKQFQAMAPFRQIIPTGPVYKAYGWIPKPEEITEFLSTARSLNLSAANFFAWDYGRTIMLDQWNAIAQFHWPPYPIAKDMTELYIEALNTHNPDIVASLYTPDAVHITSANTIQGTSAINTWYTTFLNQVLPQGQFRLTGFTGSDISRHFTWEATSTAGNVYNGNDTIGMLNGQIAYHYSFFTKQL